MATATYTLEMELAFNVWTDCTADWLIEQPCIIERGIAPGERVARIGKMALAMYNPSGRYTPGHANVRAGFDVGVRVRLKANDGVTTYTLFTGRLSEVDVAAGIRGDAALLNGTAIVVEDDMAGLSRVPVSVFPLMTSARSDTVIKALMDAAVIPLPLETYWLLGSSFASKLPLKLSSDSTGRSFATGQSTFPYAGDLWGPEVKTRTAIQDVCVSEWGYFYIKADGTPVFLDRHARPKHTVADAAISGSSVGIHISRGENMMVNQVRATVYPRTVGGSTEVLWSAAKSFELRYGTPVTVHAHFKDPNQLIATFAATSVITPVLNTDYRVTNLANGTGTDYGANVTITFQAGATGAQLVFTLAHVAHLKKVYVHALQLRGTALRTFQPVLIVTEDSSDWLKYGQRPMALDMVLQDDAAVAADIGTAVIANRKSAASWLDIDVEGQASSTLLTQALSREIGDRLSVTESTLVLSAAGCFIEGIRHEILGGGARHHVTWRTSPADVDQYWVLGTSGFSELGITTKLGY